MLLRDLDFIEHFFLLFSFYVRTRKNENFKKKSHFLKFSLCLPMVPFPSGLVFPLGNTEQEPFQLIPAPPPGSSCFFALALSPRKCCLLLWVSWMVNRQGCGIFYSSAKGKEMCWASTLGLTAKIPSFRTQWGETWLLLAGIEREGSYSARTAGTTQACSLHINHAGFLA